MKKSLMALACASAFAASANAQSTLTTYGIVDMGYVHESGGASGSVDKITSGAQSGTRLGFKGTEDLGDNMKALFVLETGIAADQGGYNQGGLAFARQSFVGLQSDFGTLTLGNQYSSYFLALNAVDPFASGMAGAAQHLMLPAAEVRMKNTVKYASPVFSNFSGEVAYGLGEVAGNDAASRVVSASLSYSLNPINVRLAHIRSNNSADTDYSSRTILGANWDLTFAKAFVAFADNNELGGTDNRDFLVGATVPFNKHTFIASYIRKDEKSALNRDASQLGIGYTYALSKRTNLYAAWGSIDNKRGGLLYKVGNNSELGTGDKAFNLGVRHTF